MSYPHHWIALSRQERTHKCCKNHAILRDISWYHYTCKNLNISYLFFYYITRSSGVVITSWNPFTQWTSIWNVYSALQQQNNFEFWEMPPATQHDRIAQDYPEKKIPVNVSHSFILFHFFLFLKRSTSSARDMSNCTKSVCSFRFAVHAILHHSGVLSFSFLCHVQHSWWKCSSCDRSNEVWFITEDVGIIDQTRGGVTSHSLIWPSRVCVAAGYTGFQGLDS